MAWPHLDGIIKVVVTFGYDGQASINVHFVLERTPSSPITSASLEAAADAVQISYLNEWRNIMATAWAVDNVTATDWSLPDGEQIQTGETLPFDGLDANDPLPASVSLVVSHRTDHTGRSRRGRTYLPGITENRVLFNDVDATAIEEANETFVRLALELDLVDMDHVIYSLFSDGAPRTVPLATLVTNRIINNRVDTQRRRLP